MAIATDRKSHAPENEISAEVSTSSAVTRQPARRLSARPTRAGAPAAGSGVASAAAEPAVPAGALISVRIVRR